MKKMLFVAPLVMMLSACGTPSVEDFIDDPEMLGEVLQECQMLQMQGKDASSEECVNAKKAARQMGKNMMNGIMKDMNSGFQR